MKITLASDAITKKGALARQEDRKAPMVGYRKDGSRSGQSDADDFTKANASWGSRPR